MCVCGILLYDNATCPDIRTHSSVWLIGSTCHNKISPVTIRITTIQLFVCVCVRVLATCVHVCTNKWRYLCRRNRERDIPRLHTHTHTLLITACIVLGESTTCNYYLSVGIFDVMIAKYLIFNDASYCDSVYVLILLYLSMFYC